MHFMYKSVGKATQDASIADQLKSPCIIYACFLCVGLVICDYSQLVFHSPSSMFNNKLTERLVVLFELQDLWGSFLVLSSNQKTQIPNIRMRSVNPKKMNKKMAA